MLNAIAGGESLEILVMLRDLSSAGLTKLQANIKRAEMTANRTNFSGFSKSAKTLEKDAARAAGRGGVGGLGSSFLGLPGPIGIAAVAIGTFAGLMATVIPTYEKVERQNLALATAFKDHGQSLDALRPQVDAAIKDGEKYAFTADQTRDGITRLATAGLKWADIQKALPHIMDLARFKHWELGETATKYTLALMGNQRALKDLGIVLPTIPKVHLSIKDATLKAKIAHQELALAVAHLKTLQAGHAVTVTHLSTTVNAHAVITEHATKSTKGHTASAKELARAHIAVEKATLANSDAQAALRDAQGKGIDLSARAKLANEKLTGAVGDQKGSITELDKKTAGLSNKWELFSTAIGPGLQTVLGGIVDALQWILDRVITLLDILPKIAAAQSAAAAASPSSYGGRSRGFGPPPPPPHGPHRADGGWIGLRGPEMFMGGEKGPEFVTRNSHLGGMGGGGGIHLHINTLWPPTPEQVRRIADALDHHEYFRSIGVAASGSRA